MFIYIYILYNIPVMCIHGCGLILIFTFIMSRDNSVTDSHM